MAEQLWDDRTILMIPPEPKKDLPEPNVVWMPESKRGWKTNGFWTDRKQSLLRSRLGEI
jgi:hypothetical protein